ncbi:MAG: Rieske (2Fe-2S) protein [Chitinophagales bacterium]|nr:Rieske (2Fe-2S) protein [Chitinophagales bacterium]MDW8274059.1 Rieske (2Fe-2S) protein [Chitinophagales bacterium]
MKRKDFLETACRACGFGLLTGLLLSEESCAPHSAASVTKFVPQDGKITVPLAQIGNNAVHVIQVKGKDPVGIIKKEDGNYFALSLACTHQGTTVRLKDGKFVCPLHGSIFSTNGAVEKGPAKRPLQTLRVLALQDALEIYL